MQKVMPRLGIKTFRTFWEPACGEGHMSEVLDEYFVDGFASDIHDYGGNNIRDFLMVPAIPGEFDWIITNPPFRKKALAFTLRALDLARVGVAMFARVQWLDTIGRHDQLFKPTPPTLIAFFSERVPLHMGRWEPDGRTATFYCWLVWLHGARRRPPFWIPPGCRKKYTHADDRERFAK